ncbi:MAG: hypothetical protein AB7P20_28085 [Rhizobiaceae bacterium]
MNSPAARQAPAKTQEGLDLCYGITRCVGDHVQSLTKLVRCAERAADLIERLQPAQGREAQFLAVVSLQEHFRPAVSLLYLGGRLAPGRDQRRTEVDLQRQVEADPCRFRRNVWQLIESRTQEVDGLDESRARIGKMGGLAPMLYGQLWHPA